MIIFAISSIAIGLGVGLGLGLNGDDSSDDDHGDDSVDIGPKPDGDYVVATQSGWLQGYRFDQNGKTYNDIPFNNLLPNIPHDTTYYLGVPYAAPPVGELRWKAPLDPSNWPGLRKGDTTGPGENYFFAPFKSIYDISIFVLVKTIRFLLNPFNSRRNSYFKQ